MKRSTYKKFLPLFFIFTIIVVLIYYVIYKKEGFQTASYTSCAPSLPYRHPQRIIGNFPVCYANEIKAPSTDKYFIRVRLWSDTGFTFFQPTSSDSELGVNILQTSKRFDGTTTKDSISKMFAFRVLLITLNVVDPIYVELTAPGQPAQVPPQNSNLNLEDNKGVKKSRDTVVWGYFKTTPDGREDKSLSNFVPLIPPLFSIGPRTPANARDLAAAFMKNEITDFYILANAPNNAIIKMIANTNNNFSFKNVGGIAASSWATIPKAKAK